ncbi:MAG: Gfo/Idh/MocA family oxidoreductase [Phycisphaerales bacterium]|nr:MAG: Gfo/Idh/MocA family oxidoreductase [Phycisphaerales bacterium]
MSGALRAAVIGVGRMGCHHARLYHEMPSAELVAVVDIDAEKAARVAAEHQCRAFTRLSDVIDRIDVASVAVPTVYHEEVATPLIDRGVAVLIEKPMAPDGAAARRMLDRADQRGVPIQVGHSERFNPVVVTLQRMEVSPQFIEAHRISPFTFRSADIGVVFDMMIHDIDIVLHLVRDRDYRVSAVGVAVLGAHEDIANARVEFSNGAVANLTASRLALKTERKIRVFCSDAYLSMDYGKKSGIAIKKDANLDLLKMARERDFTDLSQMQNVDFGSMVNVEPLVIDDVEPLRAEISAFLSAVGEGTPPPVSGADGLAAVEMAEAVVNAVQAHGWKT